jgi:hypothetical protein
MATMAQFAMTRLDEARCEALFVSSLQPSDAPTAGMITAAVTRAVRQFGAGGCADRMAQEFGDHPDAAVRRMRWVRQLVQAAVRPQARNGTRLDGRDTAMGPVAA